MGYLRDWLSKECRIVFEHYNGVWQLKVFKENRLKGRIQFIESVEVMESVELFSATPVGVAHFMNNVSIRQFRFRELTEAPFSGEADNLFEYEKYILYQDFTRTSGLMHHHPAEYRLAGILTGWNWFSPGMPYSTTAYTPTIVEGQGVVITDEEFRAYSSYYSTIVSMEISVEWPSAPDDNLRFEIGSHALLVQYDHSSQMLRLVHYDDTTNGPYEPLPMVSSPVTVYAEAEYSFTPGETYTFESSWAMDHLFPSMESKSCQTTPEVQSVYAPPFAVSTAAA